MAKQKEVQPDRNPTRRQVARSRREQEQLRLLYMGLGGVAVLVLLVLGFGLYQTYVLEPNQPVAVVNGTDITARAYQNRVRYERFMLDQQFLQIQQQQAQLAQSENEELVQFLNQQYQQMASQLMQQRTVVDRQTVDMMIDDQIVAAEAAERGITVSDEEVTEYINQFVAGQAGGLTEQSAAATETARAEVAAFTPTPTAIVTGTAVITPTPTPLPTPTLNVIPSDTLATERANWLNTLAEAAGISESTYRTIIYSQVLRDRLREALAEETPTSAEQAHARHILVETEEEAQTVLEQLEAGEAFAALAEELSIDTGSGANGGDLGFVPQGLFVDAVDQAVFSLPVGEISEPIQSQFGWHIIEVLEREVRELTPQDYQREQQLALSKWLDQARLEADIQDLWTADKAPEDNLDPTQF